MKISCKYLEFPVAQKKLCISKLPLTYPGTGIQNIFAKASSESQSSSRTNSLSNTAIKESAGQLRCYTHGKMNNFTVHVIHWVCNWSSEIQPHHLWNCELISKVQKLSEIQLHTPIAHNPVKLFIFRCDKCQRQPPYVILHFKWFTKNAFVKEKNPTIVNFPLHGLDKDDPAISRGRKTLAHKVQGSDVQGPPSPSIFFNHCSFRELKKYICIPPIPWHGISDLYHPRSISLSHCELYFRQRFTQRFQFQPSFKRCWHR
jgi:hypothetical protein